MQESLPAGARVVWVGLPMMAHSSVLSDAFMVDLNSVYQAEAASSDIWQALFPKACLSGAP